MHLPSATRALMASAMFAAFAVESRAATFTGVGDLPGGDYWSMVSGLSADGTTVVGSSNSAEGREAYRRRKGEVIEGLGDLPGSGPFLSWANAVSADGSTVVGAATVIGVGALGFPLQADTGFRWTEALGMEGLPAFFVVSYATAVSADGSIIAGVEGFLPCVGCGCCQGWGAWVNEDDAEVWHLDYQDVEPYGQVDTPEVLAISADGSSWGGYVLAQVGDPPSISVNGAVIWTAGGTAINNVVFANDSRIHGLSPDASTAVGEVGNEAYVWTAGGGHILLGYLAGGNRSFATDVSADGSIVVGASRFGSGLDWEPFVWDAENGMRSLTQVLTCRGANLAGWDLTSFYTWTAYPYVVAISDDAFTIAGNGTNPDGNPEGWIATLPAIAAACEPAMMPAASGPATALLISLLLGLGVACRPIARRVVHTADR